MLKLLTATVTERGSRQLLFEAHKRIQSGIKPPHFCNILNGKKHLPPFAINAFEWVMGNRAVSLTIERFREIRKEESALELARRIVGA